MFPCVCTGSLKRAALPRGSVLPWSSGQKKSLSSISGTCEQIVVEVDGTLATQKKMEKGPFSVDVRSIRHSAAALPSPTIAPTSRETSGEGGRRNNNTGNALPKIKARLSLVALKKTSTRLFDFSTSVLFFGRWPFSRFRLALQFVWTDGPVI